MPGCLKDLIEGCHHPYVLAGAVEYAQAIHMETLVLIDEPEGFAEECTISASGKMITLCKLIQELVTNAPVCSSSASPRAYSPSFSQF